MSDKLDENLDQLSPDQLKDRLRHFLEQPEMRSTLDSLNREVLRIAAEDEKTNHMRHMRQKLIIEDTIRLTKYIERIVTYPKALAEFYAEVTRQEHPLIAFFEITMFGETVKLYPEAVKIVFDKYRPLQEENKLNIPTLTEAYLLVEMIQPTSLDDLGPGEEAFKKALTKWDSQDYDDAAKLYEQALEAGLISLA
jgi:hypothetical protein